MASLIHIDDLDDERLADYRDLRDADLRGARRLFTVESLRVVRRFLASGWPVESLLLEPEPARDLAPLLDQLDPVVPVHLAPAGSMRAITGYGFHGGALALGRRGREDRTLDRFAEILARPLATIVAAEGVVHVDNMGSLFRNAACLGADAVLLAPDCADPLLRKTLRISCGRVFELPWSFVEPWPETLQRLKDEHGFTVVGLDTHPDASTIDAMPAEGRMTLLFGAEGPGLSRGAIEACDRLCEIPVRSGGDQDDASINVAVASGIALHERFRRIRTGNDLD